MGLFNFGKRTSNEKKINWEQLTGEEQLEDFIQSSHDKPVAFFKHSTRCSISSMALSRLENNWNLEEEQVIPVYLDLIRYREISNKLAHELNVTHQSPQLLVVKDGKCIYHASHNQVDVEGVKQHL